MNNENVADAQKLMVDKIDLPDGIVKVVLGSGKNEEGRVAGDFVLDFANDGICVDAIETILNEGKSKLIFDMVNVTHVDSSGMWAVFESHKKTKAKKGKMGIINVKEKVYNTFKSLHMTNNVNIFDNEEAAIVFLRGK